MASTPRHSQQSTGATAVPAFADENPATGSSFSSASLQWCVLLSDRPDQQTEFSRCCQVCDKPSIQKKRYLQLPKTITLISPAGEILTMVVETKSASSSRGLEDVPLRCFSQITISSGFEPYNLRAPLSACYKTTFAYPTIKDRY